MIPNAEDAQRRAFQRRGRALSQNSSENGGNDNRSPRYRPTDGEHRNENSFMRDASSQSLGNPSFQAVRRSGSRSEDDEFEEFHRSFTTGSSPLEMLAGSNHASPDLFTSSTSQRVQPRQQTPDEVEDPTILQARESMMARTGDRHARGKLPEPREGKFQPPHSSPVEPRIPQPRGSKRYVKQKHRVPDVIEGMVSAAQATRMEDDKHVVVCAGCQLPLVVRKDALLVRCQVCQNISPVAS